MDSRLSASHVRGVNLPTPRTRQLLAAEQSEFNPEKRRATYAKLEGAVLDRANAVGVAGREQGCAVTQDPRGFQSLPGAWSFSGAMLDGTGFAQGA